MNSDQPKRKPNRLAGYDYSQNGAYFITICAQNRAEIFSTVGANCVRPFSPIRPQLSAIGIIVEKEIHALSRTYNQVAVDCYVVMPNHVHMIVVISEVEIGGGTGIENGRTQFAPTVSRMVKQWKGAITKQLGFSPWQKSFHDRIIRNEEEYAHIAEYIETNPARWTEDCFYAGTNPVHVGANCVRPNGVPL
jgi:REP element-mobilizing transposase RayT